VSSEIHLVNESIGSLFTIPEGDWTQISKRVGLALLAKDISWIVQPYYQYSSVPTNARIGIVKGATTNMDARFRGHDDK
jgi:hypothetical protein